MARRSREEILASIDRLVGIFYVYIEWAKARKGEAGSVYARYPTKDERMAALREQGLPISKYERGFIEALNDIAERMQDAAIYDPVVADSFLAHYQEQTGRDFWDDVGKPDRAAKAIVQRGSIRDTTEWRLLNSVLSNVDQTVFKGTALTRAEALLAEFEATYEGDGD